jgi:hypothetical protein
MSGKVDAGWARFNHCAVNQLEDGSWMITIRANDGTTVKFKHTPLPNWIQ